MSNLLAPLALAVGLNQDPALYDRLQFEGLLRPGAMSLGSQLAHADAGYSTKNFEVSAGGSTTLDRKFTGANVGAKIPLDALEFFMTGDFINPSAGNSIFGGELGVGASHEAQFGPVKGEISVAGDTASYVSGKVSGSAQYLNHLMRLILESSHRSGQNRQRFSGEYFWRPSDNLELGAGIGSSQRGIEGMLHAGIDYSKLRVEVNALGNNQYQVASVGLSWNSPSLFNQKSLSSNKYLREQARIKRTYKSEAGRISSNLSEAKEKIKEMRGERTQKESQELTELVEQAQDKWSDYKEIIPEEDVIEVCGLWKQVYDIDQGNKELKRFIEKTSGIRYAMAKKHMITGNTKYTSNVFDGAINEYKVGLRLLTGSEDGDSVLVNHDPDALIRNNLNYIEKAKQVKKAMAEPQPTIIASPSSASSTAKPKQ